MTLEVAYIKLDMDLKAWLEDLAKEEKRTLSSQICFMLERCRASNLIWSLKGDKHDQ